MIKIIKSKKRKILALVAILAIAVSAIFVFYKKPGFLFASSYSFFQTDWAGGASTTAVATDPTDRTGWTKYFSKAARMNTVNSELKISTSTSVWQETSDADFNASSSATNIYVSGGTVYPKKPNTYACDSNNDNFCQSGRCDTTCQAKVADGNACDEASDCTSNYCNGSSVCETPALACDGSQGTINCGDNCSYSSVTYNTVDINGQCWFKENLNVGTAIGSKENDNSTLKNQTNNSVIEKYCYGYVDNDDASQIATGAANCASDGGLYQWAEAVQYKEGASNTTSLQPTEPVQGICPAGWHIPTDTDQYNLENYLTTGSCISSRTTWGCDPAGSRLSLLTLNGNNNSGFTALLAGGRGTDGAFSNRGTNGYFWSSTQSDATNAWRRFLASSVATVFRSGGSKAIGFSVRCLKN